MAFSTTTLLEYGVTRDTLIDEIKAELLIVITSAVNSQFFDRTKGVGVNNLENEMISVEELIILKVHLLLAISDYSSAQLHWLHHTQPSRRAQRI